jgi:hypothetical protein
VVRELGWVVLTSKSYEELLSVAKALKVNTGGRLTRGVVAGILSVHKK